MCNCADGWVIRVYGRSSALIPGHLDIFCLNVIPLLSFLTLPDFLSTATPHVTGYIPFPFGLGEIAACVERTGGGTHDKHSLAVKSLSCYCSVLILVLSNVIQIL